MIKFFTVVDLVFFKLILFMHMFHIYLGEDSSSLEKTAANDLVDDLELITTKKANIHQINEEFLSEEEDLQFPDDGDLIIVGTPDSNPLIKHFIIKKEISLTKENPGPRGRLIHLAKDVRLKNRELFLILGGSDAQ